MGHDYCFEEFIRAMKEEFSIDFDLTEEDIVVRKKRREEV